MRPINATLPAIFAVTVTAAPVQLPSSYKTSIIPQTWDAPRSPVSAATPRKRDPDAAADPIKTHPVSSPGFRPTTNDQLLRPVPLSTKSPSSPSSPGSKHMQRRQPVNKPVSSPGWRPLLEREAEPRGAPRVTKRPVRKRDDGEAGEHDDELGDLNTELDSDGDLEYTAWYPSEGDEEDDAEDGEIVIVYDSSAV